MNNTNILQGINYRTKGVLLSLLGATLMSLDFIFIRFSGVSGFDTAFLFGFFTTVSMSVYIQFFSKDSLKSVVKTGGFPLFISGFLMLVSATSLIFATKNTSVANVAVIYSAAPAIAALVSWLFLREKTKISTWAAIVSIIIGLSIVVSGSFQGGHLFGNAIAILGVSAVAINQTLVRKYKHISRIAAVGAGGLLLAIVMLFLANPSSYSLQTWIVMALMGLFSAPFGRVFVLMATRYITAPEVGIIIMLETVLAPMWAYAFFREIPTCFTIIGGIVIFATIVAYSLAGIKKE